MIGALGAVSQRFAGYVNKVGALELSQKTSLLGTARLLRKVLSLQGQKSRNTVVPSLACCYPLLRTRKSGHIKSEMTNMNNNINNNNNNNLCWVRHKTASGCGVSKWDNEVTICQNYLQVTLEQVAETVSATRGQKVPGWRPVGDSLCHG